MSGVKETITEPVLIVLPEAQKLEVVLKGLLKWSAEHLLTLATLQQLVIVAICLFLAWRLALRSAKFLTERASSWNNSFFLMVPRIFVLSKYEVLLLLYMPLGLWIVRLVFVAGQWSAPLIDVASTLIFAWSVIRLSSGVIRSTFWSKVVSVFLWLIAALNIFGWLAPTMIFLDKAAINFDGGKLSLLLMIKSLLVVMMLVWLSGVLSEGMDRLLFYSNSLNPSQRVMFSKVFRVVLFLVSFLIVLNFAGIDLTALAIFSGAIGIGIGFGMQRTFANLISGFILLMDKSIKPGDVIAVGDTYGWVNRLGTRCVSILTRDGKEHLIPNETLITSRVENWSYSDNNVRVKVPVGVAYGSDRKKVKELLLKAVSDTPRVLRQPTPVCLITGFGDSSINFELRFWIDDPANGVMNIKSVVHENILDLFKENHISIPFPQRDVYVHRGTNAPPPGEIYMPDKD